jgi:hypothetical protein
MICNFNTTNGKIFAAGVIFMSMIFSVTVYANSRPVGGGFTDGGITGEYFNGTDSSFPSGNRAFTRHDIRVDFDWNTLLPIGGSRAASWNNFPTDNFSVRWTGQILPRFSETYTFELEVDDGARLFIRPEGGSWTTLVDQWDTAGIYTASFGPMTADQRYDIRLEYKEVSGAAKVMLRWSSSSTPQEVIDAITMSNHTHASVDWADGVRLHTDWQNTTQDTNGWPQGDTVTILNGNYDLPNGTYQVRFKGKAEVVLNTGSYFEVNGTKTLPYGTNYNAADNTTSARFVVPTVGKVFLTLNKTSRAGSASPTYDGVTEIQVMTPIAVGANQPHEFGESMSRITREILKSYATFRWQTLGLTSATSWSQRTMPTFGHFEDQFIHNQHCIETIIMGCNEAGRDIYLNFGTLVDHNYMTQMANLLKYGSDASGTVYTTYTANPYHPPLNPNLRIYLEHGNEQNWSGIKGPTPVWSEWLATDDGRIANYDGAAGTAPELRWHIIRTVRASQCFRNVFGDAAMGERVRPQIFGQYEQARQTYLCQFADDYFNNGNGTNVPSADWPYPARPVNAHLWGAGGALYASSSNNWGALDPDWFANGNFETVDVAAGTASLRPTGTSWSFSGNAGICDVKIPRNPAITNNPSGTAGNSLAATTWVGFKFRVGASDVYVYEVGRYKNSGNSQSHKIMIDNTSGTDQINSSNSVTLSSGTAGQYVYTHVFYSSWSTSDSRQPAPVRLAANQEYYIVSQEAVGGDSYINTASPATAASGITILGAVTSTDGIAYTVNTAGSFALGGVNFKFTNTPLTTADGTVGVPADDTYETDSTLGQQCAFLVGTGSMSQTVNFAKSGHYAVKYWSANTHVTKNKLTVKVDGTDILTNILPQGSRKNAIPFFFYSTHYFAAAAGAHTISFYGTQGADTTLFLDGIAIIDMDAYFGGPEAANMPATGGATGMTEGDFGEKLQAESEMALNWGLVPTVYEGGWHNGDWQEDNVWHWIDAEFGNYAPAFNYMAQANENLLASWAYFGGQYYMYYMETYSNLYTANTYPVHQGVVLSADLWLTEPGNGHPVPAVLTQSDEHYQSNPANDYYGPTSWRGLPVSSTIGNKGWKSWVILVPSAGYYQITLNATAGGNAQLSIDESTTVASGASNAGLSGILRLTKGIHTVKVRNVSGSFSVNSVSIVSASTNTILTDTSAVTVSEGGTNTFSVKLMAAPAEPVVVSVDRVSGDTDITVINGALLSFDSGNWDIYQTVTLAAAEDADADDGAALVRCTAVDFTSADVNVTEADNEFNIVTSTNAVTVPEGGTAFFDVQLSENPGGEVTVNVSRVSGDSNIQVSGGSLLVFNSGNWNIDQTVTLSASQDADTVNGTAVIECTIPGASTQSVTATEADDDTPPGIVVRGSGYAPTATNTTTTATASFMATNSGLAGNYLIIAAVSETANVTSMTFNGSPMIQLYEYLSTGMVEFFGIATSSLSGTVNVTYSGNVFGTQIYGYAFLDGVDTASPLRATAGGVNATGTGSLTINYSAAAVSGDFAMLASNKNATGKMCSVLPVDTTLYTGSAGASFSGLVAYDAALLGGSYSSAFSFTVDTQREVAAGVILKALPAPFVPNPDITGNGFVDLADFAMLAAEWQNACASPDWCDDADIDHSQSVDMEDLMIMATSWLQ